MPQWSYSAIKTFANCPKKYYHTKVKGDVVDRPGPAALFGQRAHEAAEYYIKEGTPIPPQYKCMQAAVEALSKIEGEKWPEMKLALRKTEDGYEPTDFDGVDYWWRGIADLVIINGERAHLVDYKTGKSRYADPKQLDLLAGALFTQQPSIKSIKSALFFVKEDVIVDKVHTRDKTNEYLSVFNDELVRLQTAFDNDVWNANPTALCNFCPVSHCGHHPDSANKMRWG